MHPHTARVQIAACIREAWEHLAEASERAYDLKLFQLSGTLLDIEEELVKLHEDLVQLDRERSSALPPPHPGADIDNQRLPF